MIFGNILFSTEFEGCKKGFWSSKWRKVGWAHE